jgi:plasmid stabilization system protein ParE
MPRGDKSKYTDKQKRKAEHIAESYEDRGVPVDEAESRAWATVNKESGGGNKSGSGRGVPDTKVSSKKGGKLGGAASAARPASERSAAARKAAAARTPEQRSASARKAAATRKRNRAGSA